MIGIMIKRIVWAVIFIVIAAFLQSTIIRHFALLHTIPDLTLIILVFAAYTNGTMSGQITGFFSGLLLDFISAAPLGFNALVRTIIGAAVGLIKGIFFLDIIFLPMFLSGGATILKAICRNLLSLIFSNTILPYNFLQSIFWIELGLNIAIAPIIFALLKLAKNLLTEGRKIK